MSDKDVEKMTGEEKRKRDYEDFNLNEKGNADSANTPGQDFQAKKVRR
jgi:hypothetical protein